MTESEGNNEGVSFKEGDQCMKLLSGASLVLEGEGDKLLEGGDGESVCGESYVA